MRCESCYARPAVDAGLCAPCGASGDLDGMLGDVRSARDGSALKVGECRYAEVGSKCPCDECEWLRQEMES